jgi:hypothetical protein
MASILQFSQLVIYYLRAWRVLTNYTKVSIDIKVTPCEKLEKAKPHDSFLNYNLLIYCCFDR